MGDVGALVLEAPRAQHLEVRGPPRRRRAAPLGGHQIERGEVSAGEVVREIGRRQDQRDVAITPEAA